MKLRSDRSPHDVTIDVHEICTAERLLRRESPGRTSRPGR
jgi:hypothetical protein